MSLLRRVAVCAALAVVASLTLASRPGSAVTGYDARYFGESAFALLQTGQSNQFAVGFTNTGSVGWAIGTSSQVNLAQCCPINSPSRHSAWAVSWLSSTAYATTTTDYVGPGQVGWFVYTVKAPATVAPGDYRFDGDLVIASTGEAIYPEGYFQVATVRAAVSGGGSLASAVVAVSCLNLREIRVRFNQAMATSGTGSVTDRDHYALRAGPEIDGARAAADGTSVLLTLGRSITGTGIHDGAQLSNNPYSFMAQNGTYDLTVQNVVTAGFQLTAPSTTRFACTDSAPQTVAPSSVPGPGSVILTFSEPMDPSTLNDAVLWDRTPMASIGGLRWQDRSANVCAAANGCFTMLRLDFSKTTIPSQGDHLLEIRDARDAAGLKLSPNPTVLKVGMPGPLSGAPPVGDVVVSAVGSSLRIDVTFRESMAHSANGFDSSESIDTPANYVLRNPDGSPATTTGAPGGTAIIIDRVLPNLTPSDPSLAFDERQLVTRDTLAFELRRARLVLTPSGETLRPGVAYTLEIRNVRDESGNPVTPGTVRTVVWGGGATPP